MPLHIRAQCTWQIASLLPRDGVTIDPCFRVEADPLQWPGGTDSQQLATDLANALYGWGLSPTNHQLTVKLYDIEGAKPVRPMATKVLQPNSAAGSNGPGELAVCLSFYGGSNLPQNRGRLYLPYSKVSNGSPAMRPTATEMAKVAALPALFSALGGVNVDWIVWSPTYRAATKVDHYWVDDEWDIQRKRGLRGTTRNAGSTSG